jgi:hypothetical protein
MESSGKRSRVQKILSDKKEKGKNINRLSSYA